MIKLRNSLLLVLVLLSISAVSAQEIKTYVNDYANILSPEEEAMLSSIGHQLQTSGSLEYAIVTVSSLENEAIESYSLRLAQDNLGDKTNNGLLLLVSVEDRQYRFEVGRGVEYMLNDAKVGRIGRYYLVPNFQEGNYGKGIIEASMAVKSVFLNETDSDYYVVVNEQRKRNAAIANLVSNLIFYFIFFLIFFGPAYSKKRKKDKYFDAAMAAIFLFGGGRRGGGSGGFGGFGGGGFGGGGASGGW